VRFGNYCICIPPAIQRFTTPNKCSFSNAALTLSLSANCLFTACSLTWVPLSILMSTLKREGRDRKSLTRRERPINVAMEQWGIVGVNCTWTVENFFIERPLFIWVESSSSASSPSKSTTSINSRRTTFNC